MLNGPSSSPARRHSPFIEETLKAAIPHLPQAFAEAEQFFSYPGLSLSPLDGSHYRKCAVLLLVYLSEGKPHLIGELRASHLQRFPGMMAFPGGGVEVGETEIEAALRECKEEVSATIPPERVLGCAPPIFRVYDDGTGYEITAAIAFLEKCPALRADPSEVERTIEIPLALPRAAQAAGEAANLRGISLFIYEGLRRAIELGTPA